MSLDGFEFCLCLNAQSKMITLPYRAPAQLTHATLSILCTLPTGGCLMHTL